MSKKEYEIPLFPFEQAKLAELNTQNYSSLVDMFEQSCRDHTARVAYTAIGQDIRFSEVESMTAAFAAYLAHDCGLVTGDRVAIQLPNIAQYPIVAWGALRAGLASHR